MALASIRNHRGFFSDYWLGTLHSARAAAGARWTPAQARKALDRITRAVESVDTTAAPDLTHFRERLARPVLEEVLGFEMRENSAEPRVRALAVGIGGNTAPVALALLCPDAADLESRQGRRQLEEGLLACGLDYGIAVSPDVLRLVRKPGSGARGAAFDLSLESAIEQQDTESLAVAYRVLAAPNFVQGEDGRRPIDVLESESRRHSAKVSGDLKEAVFEAAERIVGGFLADVRSRNGEFSPSPGITDLRDAGFLALYRLLFILYAEARDERLINHRLYQRSYSLDGMVARLLTTPPDRLGANRSGLWFHLQAVFRIFNEGIAPNLPDLENIPPRGGRLFSEETKEGKLLQSLRLDDRQAAAILLALGTTRPRRGVGRERISFRELEIEQLGSVYEGLLEYEPEVASGTLVEVSVGGRELALTPEEVVRLCGQKQLRVAGDVELVAGTAAEALHPDAALANAEESEGEEEAGESEAEESEEEDEEQGVSRGAVLHLLRRLEPGTFYFKPGSARKASGSFYTPTPMVDYLAREALGPLVSGRSAEEILKLRVIDIACGSGHFLVGAARYLGSRLFEAYRREAGANPPPDFHPDRALSTEVRNRWEAEGQDWCKRRIVEKCLFGVDLNPAAVQLAQVALWIESLAGDRPLSFFAHHIRCGNSLLGSWLDHYDSPPISDLGTSPDQRTRGLFESVLKTQLQEALTERRLIDTPLPPEVRADTAEEYAYKEDRLRRAELAVEQARLMLDLRAASAFLPLIWSDFPMLMSALDLEQEASARSWWAAFNEIRRKEHFFHWELEFPEVLLDPSQPGFDVILGNPPWDEVRPKKYEFYARHDALIRALTGSELERRIQELHVQIAGLKDQFDGYCTRIGILRKLLKQETDFPLLEARSHLSRVDVSKYFVDRAIRICRVDGVVGMVVPAILYNGDACVGIRRFLLEQATIQRFYGFENRKKIFPIHSSYKFVNLVFRKAAPSHGFEVTFMRHDMDELAVNGQRPWQVHVNHEEIAKLSPETLAFLEYRSPRDREIINKMYKNRPTLGGNEPGAWGVRLFDYLAHENLYNATWDKDLWTAVESNRMYTPQLVLGAYPGDMPETIERMRERGFWPVYEGKHVDQFLVGVKPIRWWLSVEQAKAKYGREPRADRTLVFRETASNTNERTCIAAVLPPFSAASHKLTGVLADHVDPDAAMTVLNSLCFDFALRLRTAGTNVSFTYILPMAVPPAEVVNQLPKIDTRPAWTLGFVHISEDEATWPSLWTVNKAVGEAYGLNASDFTHVLGSFPVLARKRQKFLEFLRNQIAGWNPPSQR